LKKKRESKEEDGYTRDEEAALGIEGSKENNTRA